tara:strand:+ start:347 stop:784 length:438 start_codon:yes stop_codon:yes gene_type:complete
MKINLEKKDIDNLLLESFCNGGLTELYHCDVNINWNDGTNNTNYFKAKEMLLKEGKSNDDLCMEDIFLKVFQKFGIVIDDFNSDEQIILNYELAEFNLNKSLEDVENREWFFKQVNKVIPEYDNADAWTYFFILQGIIYGEQIYC